MHDPLEALRSAGCPVDHLNAAQRDVLAALTEPETAILVTIQHRLRDAEGDVIAHNLKML
jgi:hypothetical protein